MPFALSGLINFLPQFIIGGLVAVYFYSTFGKKSPDRQTPEFILVRQAAGEETDQVEVPVKDLEEHSALDTVMQSYAGGIDDESTEQKLSEIDHPSALFTPYEKDPGDSRSLLADAQLILLSLDLWILVSLLLSPVSRLTNLLPSVSSSYSTVIYLALSIALALAVLTTIVSRVNITRKSIAIMIAIGGGVTLAAFFAPSMIWVDKYSELIRIVIIYSAVAVVCIAVYALSTSLKKRTAFTTSAYASFTSYGLTAFVLFYNIAISLSL